MISKKTAKAINAQINREFYSAFLYLAMANDAMAKGFKGAANWFSIQFKEEQEHALKFGHYLQEQGSKVELAAIAAPKTEWKDLLDMFKDALGDDLTLLTLNIDDQVFKLKSLELQSVSDDVQTGDSTVPLTVEYAVYDIDQT